MCLLIDSLAEAVEAARSREECQEKDQLQGPPVSLQGEEHCMYIIMYCIPSLSEYPQLFEQGTMISVEGLII